jgi:hypothetical protein
MASHRQIIRKVLDTCGLEDVASAHELFQHIAAQCESHDDFRKLIDKTEPAQRVRAYETLKPHLRFEAKPLDVYIAENQNEAERKQLPIVTADGKLAEFKKPEIRTDAFVIAEAIQKSLSKIRMTVVCRKCTREAAFFGDRKADCISQARSAGWAHDETLAVGGETCPACLGFEN